MVLLWLLKIIYSIAFYGFVIESQHFWFNDVKNYLNPIEVYHIKNQFFYTINVFISLL